jgi:hypothetical protein
MKKLSKHQRLLQIQTKHLLLFAWGVAAVCLLVWYMAMQVLTSAYPQRLVTIYDRGMKRTILTPADTARDALRVASISVEPQDVVEPSIDTKLTTSDADVIIYRSRLLSVADGNIRQTVMTVRQSPNEILQEAGLKALDSKDTTAFRRTNSVLDGVPTELVVSRAKKEDPKPAPVIFQPKPNALTSSKGAHVYVDTAGVAHRETYYDLPMNIVIRSCGAGGSYTIRSDGAKVDQDGYVLVAANYAAYPRCTVVDTSMGPGKVYDTGGFVVRHPYGFDLATDWTNYDGR